MDESKESKAPESESEKKKNVIVPAGLRLRQPDEEIVDQRVVFSSFYYYYCVKISISDSTTP